MKHGIIFAGLGMVLALSACSKAEDTAPDPAPEAATETVPEAPEPAAPTPAPPPPDSLTYSDAYYITDFWTGEYPGGLAVTGADVVVEARTQMHIDAPRNVTCPLPQNANYHPWNQTRANADELVFKSVSEKTPITITSDISIEADLDGIDSVSKLDLKAGDVFLYLSYVGEGYFLAEFEGREYLLNEGTLVDSAEFAAPDSQPHEWVQVKCGDDAGTRGWILLSEALPADGLTGRQLAAYGEAYDLDDERMAEAFAP